MNSVLSAAHFHDEAAAYAFLEARIWPNGPVCPHCQETVRISKMNGQSTRIGVYKCYACRKQFSVKVGTVFESSHVKLHIWLQAVTVLASSKKGFSSNQFARMLGVTLKTAWFMSHRIREAMRDGSLGPLGGAGKIVEADETYYGRSKQEKQLKRPRAVPYTKTGWKGKGAARPIVALVERGGRVRTFHVENADKATVNQIVSENISRESRVHTDESRLYGDVADQFAAHKTVKHSAGEYVRTDLVFNADETEFSDEKVHINSAEGYFSVFKRGMKGVYQHCAEKHLHRYLAEFDFRHNNRVRLGCDDTERADRTLRGIVGKRLTYRTAH
jgi:transposase-like protein